MLGYITSDQSPVYKFKENTATGAAAVWTPTTSTKVGVAGIAVANATGLSGTFQLRFGNVAGDVIFAGALASSTSVTYAPGLPIQSMVYDRAVFFDTSVSGSAGSWMCSISGFEYGGN